MAASSHAGPRSARGFRTSFPLAGAADPIGAPPGARQDVIDADDSDALTQQFAEDRQFRATKRLAGGCCRANRTMVLDEQERAVGLLGTACHVAFAAADIGKGRKLAGQGTPL